MIAELSRRRRFVECLFPALLAPLQIGLFGPHTIYSTNEAEFTAGFGALVMHLAVPVLLAAGALIAIGLVLPAKLFRRYVAVLFAVGLLCWIQGNLLVPDYGPLDGSPIEWSAHDDRNVFEIAMWVVVPLLAFAAAHRIFPAAVFGSRVLVALQALLLLVTAVQAESPDRWRGPSDAMFELSRTRNVFHLVLDSFQSDAFLNLVETDRAGIDRSFSGFVFFPDHAGAFPTTMVSIPAMLSGAVYRNDAPLPQYVRTVFDKGSLFRTLRAHEYRVDSITELSYDSTSATFFFRMPRPYVSYQEYTRFAAWQLADLALFRHVPHAARPAIYNDQEWRLQTWFGGRSTETKERRYHPVNGEVVLADFARRMTPAVDEPVYKFLHVGIPHPPVTVNERCEYIGPARHLTREGYAGQIRCAVARVEAFLDRLRELNLYDSSLIVISSDHGVRLPPRQFSADRAVPGAPLSDIAGRAMALLIVKPAHSTGPLRVSYAPTAIGDIPATVLDALGLPKTLPGEPALKLAEDAKRERSFANYPWEDGGWALKYFEYMDVFRVNGRLRDGGAWTLADTIYAPEVDLSARSRGLGDFRRSRNGVVYRWSDPIFFLHAPAGARGFEMAVRSIAAMPQEVTVRVGGEVVERLELPDQQWATVRHSFAEPAGSGAWIEFRVDPPWRPNRRSRVLLGVQTRDLTWH
jgi:hypothetical protein